MDSSTDGGFCFLHSWSDDLDPATRRQCQPGGAVINLEGIYLPDGDAPAVKARSSGAAKSLAIAALAVTADWFLRYP